MKKKQVLVKISNMLFGTFHYQEPNPASSYLSGGTKDVIWCYWPSTSPWHPPLPTSAQFHPCVRTQTARSRGWSSSQWSSQPRFRQAVAWGAGQDGWQGVLPPPSHCFIQFLRNLGLWVVRHRKELFPLEINTYNVCACSSLILQVSWARTNEIDMK